MLRRQRRIEEMLTRALAPVHLEVIDETHLHSVPEDAESHFRVRVVSDSFEGQPLVQRHRAVYEALAEEMGGDGGIHALGLDTLTPEEWSGGDRGQESPPCLGGSKEG